MKMEKENFIQIPEIIVKSINREASSEEIAILNEWLSLAQSNRQLYERLKKVENLNEYIQEYSVIDSAKAWEKIDKSVSSDPSRIKPAIIRVLKYAALITIPLFLATLLFYENIFTTDSQIAFNQLSHQIDNMEESSLIMADGKIVSLTPCIDKDSLKEIDGTQITKFDAEIRYDNKTTVKQKDIQFNTLITPKSKVFNITLSDGTKVWLNASSAIRYPVQFTSPTRKVYLLGEAFFEVAENLNLPFIVSTDKMDIEVTGTSFNVMAYPDDNSVEATLVEGEVIVRASKRNLTLTPGLQARLDKSSNSLTSQNVNTELYTSWKEGMYIFQYENIKNVMTKISRWYDYEIIYDENIGDKLHFSGTLQKYNDLRQTLNIIELTANVKFEILGKRIVVSRK
jgi:hypothetical protein